MILNGKTYTKKYLEQLLIDVENIAQNLEIDIDSFNFEEDSCDMESYKDFAKKYANTNIESVQPTEAISSLTDEQRTKLEYAKDKITIQMLNDLEHGEEIKLNDTFTLYHYTEDDVFVVVHDEDEVWQEILQVMTDGDEISFEAL